MQDKGQCIRDEEARGKTHLSNARQDADGANVYVIAVLGVGNGPDFFCHRGREAN